MIIRKRIVSLFLATTLLVPLAQITPLKAESNTKEVDVMFTHDTHSHLDSFTTNVDGEIKAKGGFVETSGKDLNVKNEAITISNVFIKKFVNLSKKLKFFFI